MIAMPSNFIQKLEVEAGEEIQDGELSEKQIKEIAKSPASAHLIQDFRFRNRISLRRRSFKTRRKSTEEDMQGFIALVRRNIAKYPRERIITIDETDLKAAVAGASMRWVHKNASPSIVRLITMKRRESQ
jgi:glucan phosphorylase